MYFHKNSEKNAQNAAGVQGRDVLMLYKNALTKKCPFYNNVNEIKHNMKTSLQMINVVKHLIHCLFNLTGISHSSYFLVEVKTSWRTSKYKPIPMWIYYVVMNRNF